MDLNYLKSKAGYLLTAIISIFLVMYIGFQMKITASDEEYVEVVDRQTVTVKTELSGYMFMDEEGILKGDETQGWICIPMVESGSFVDKGTVVARVYPEGDEESARKIAQIDKQLKMLEESMSANQGIISTKEYDKAVTSAYYCVVGSGISGDLFKARFGVESWLLSQSKKNIAISLVQNYNAECRQLREQRQELVTSLGEGFDVKVTGTGRYYFTSDGYEKSFDISIAQKGNYSEISSLLEGLDSTEKPIGVSCGKLLYTTKWYFVTRLENGTAGLFKTGKKYAVEFEENSDKRMTLIYDRTVKSPDGKEAYGVFYCNEMPMDFEAVRFQNVKIVSTTYEGLRIPTSSVRYVDSEVGVYIAKGNKVEFRRVKIIGEYAGSYIVKPSGDFAKTEAEYSERGKYLAEFDTVITSGKNIYEGKYIDMSKF